MIDFENKAFITHLFVGRERLHFAFDFVHVVHPDDLARQQLGLNMADFVKLKCIWVLKGYEKCAYLDPNYIALANPDLIFEEELPNSERILLPHRGDALPVFVFKPDFQTLMKISQGFQNLKEETVEAENGGTAAGLRKHFQEGNESLSAEISEPFLSRRFCQVMEKGKMLLG